MAHPNRSPEHPGSGIEGTNISVHEESVHSQWERPGRGRMTDTFHCRSAKPTMIRRMLRATSFTSGGNVSVTNVIFGSCLFKFLRDVLREKKNRLDAATTRDAILEGYQDLISGRVVEFSGDLRKTMQEAKRRDQKDWK